MHPIINFNVNCLLYQFKRCQEAVSSCGLSETRSLRLAGEIVESPDGGFANRLNTAQVISSQQVALVIILIREGRKANLIYNWISNNINTLH